LKLIFSEGTGALLAALSAPLQREPIILGKPHTPMLDAIVAKSFSSFHGGFNVSWKIRCHLDVHRTCMVGDRLDTDIAFGQQGGLKTLLVLSGHFYLIKSVSEVQFSI
jgi:4-nitrophenyl phosphatase